MAFTKDSLWGTGASNAHIGDKPADDLAEMIDKDMSTNLLSGTVTVLTGASTATSTVGTAFNGKPAFAMINQAVADATLTQMLRANVASGVLTVYGNANAAANTKVVFFIDGR